MKYKQHVNLHPYNTFHLDCIADYFVEIAEAKDLQELITTDIYQSHPRLILGGGSNILLTQDRFEGLVIKNTIYGKTVLSEDDTRCTIEVGAGENRNDFVRWSIHAGYGGLENLVSIPGTVGAAPIQNIGAYGKEVMDHIVEVSYIDLHTGEQKKIPKDACAFGYRSSVFKTDLKDSICITHVTFSLEKYIPETYTPCVSYGALQEHLQETPHITPEILATTVAHIRASKLPDWTQIGTAGSFFKNPLISKDAYHTLHEKHPTLSCYPTDTSMYKLSAGQLIELSGLKGITHGPVGTYKNHALILVHHGGGTGKELTELAKYIQTHVYDTFGVMIEPEVNYI